MQGAMVRPDQFLVEKRRRHQRWKQAGFPSIACVLLTLKAVPYNAFHSIKVLLRRPSTSCVWYLVGERLWLHCAIRVLGTYPPRFYCEQTRWTVSAGYQQTRGLWLQMIYFLGEIVLCLEKTIVVWMKHIISNFMSRGQAVADTGASISEILYVAIEP